MSYTDFSLWTEDKLKTLFAETQVAISNLLVGRWGEVTIDGEKISYVPVDLPQVRKLEGDVNAALAVKQAGAASFISAYRVDGSKGL